MVDILIGLLLNPVIQAALAIVVLAFLGYAIERWRWVRHVVALGIEAYQYAEQQGLIQGLRGYEKFDPFMDKFIQAYQERFGKPPTPEAKGIAVAAMEKQVLLEKAQGNP